MFKNTHLATYMFLMLTVAIWGGTFVAVKIIVADVAPLVGAFLRFLLASLCLIPVLIYKEKSTALVSKRDLPLLILLGLSGITFYNFFFFNGLAMTSSINGGLIIAFSPVLTTVLSPFILGENLRLRQVLGFVISLSGVIFIISKGSLSLLASLQVNKGDIYISAGAFCWSVYSMGGKIATRKYSPLLSTTYACMLGTFFLLIAAFPQLQSFSLQQLTYKSMTALIFMGVVASALSFVWWYDGIKKIGASKAAIFQNFIPVFSALFSVLILGEKFKIYHFSGAVLVILGVLISNQKRNCFFRLSSVVKNPDHL